MTVQIDSTRFGRFDVPSDRVLTVAGGLLGLPHSQRFVIVEIDDSPYFWLQSADEPAIAFLCISPWTFFADYTLGLDETVEAELALAEGEDPDVIVLLTVHRDGATVSSITANLLGPVVVNTSTGQGRQVVLEGSSYTTQEPLVV